MVIKRDMLGVDKVEVLVAAERGSEVIEQLRYRVARIERLYRMLCYREFVLVFRKIRLQKADRVQKKKEYKVQKENKKTRR